MIMVCDTFEFRTLLSNCKMHYCSAAETSHQTKRSQATETLTTCILQIELLSNLHLKEVWKATNNRTTELPIKKCFYVQNI